MSSASGKPDVIVHFGMAQSNWVHESAWPGCSEIFLVEGDPVHAGLLEKQLSGRHGVKIFTGVVPPGGTSAPELRRFNLSRFNSVREPTQLLEIFPGMVTTSRVAVPVFDPLVLTRRIKPVEKAENWLSIAMPGSELDILAALDNGVALGKFSRVFMAASRSPLYEGGATIGVIREWLQNRGFRCTRCVDDSDPDMATWQFDVDEVAGQLATAKKVIDSLETALERANRQIAQKDEALDTSKSDLEKAQMACSELEQRCDALTKEFQAMERVRDDAAELRSGVETSVRKEVENAVRQLESFLTVDRFLASGRLLPRLHRWALSPDIAHYLIELICGNHYDLIIEFGSGSSTLLMARTIAIETGVSSLKDVSDTLRIERDSSSGRDLVTERAARNGDEKAPRSSSDLVPFIVSFEHSKTYYEQTLTSLREGGVDDFAEVIHAPLGDWHTPEGDHYLYYECEDRLSQLSALLDAREAKVLVFVDGPPGTTGPAARYPALPVILNHLAKHRVDLVLDDYDRDDEREIVDKWVSLLKRRGIEFRKIEERFEKGACLLKLGTSQPGLR